MKLKTTLVVLLLLIATISQAQAKVIKSGIGASIRDGYTIYLPIVTEHLLIEPSFYVSVRDSSSTGDSTNSGDEYSSFRIGVSLYKYSNVTDNTKFYYGSQFGYLKNESKYKNGNSYSSSSKYRDEGLFVGPTIGAEHYLTQNFSIGIDASLLYFKTEGSRTSMSNSSRYRSDSEKTDFKSITNLIVRYYFK